MDWKLWQKQKKNGRQNKDNSTNHGDSHVKYKSQRKNS